MVQGFRILILKPYPANVIEQDQPHSTRQNVISPLKEVYAQISLLIEAALTRKTESSVPPQGVEAI